MDGGFCRLQSVSSWRLISCQSFRPVICTASDWTIQILVLEKWPRLSGQKFAKAQFRSVCVANWEPIMNVSKVFRLIAIFLVLCIASPCFAAPPSSGGGASMPSWLVPTQWKWPSMPWTEPPRIKKKSQGVMSDMNQSAKRGWTKTKDALNPSKIFVSDNAPKPSKASSKSTEPGFWGSVFGSKTPQKEVKTVNDFLSQPHPN
ncbi:MAG TPA: hypothetical protein DDZ51_28830 [Planctomycetaceae bacterium]|nr:hypothetical protein [Planctomycetaceae bacterium]